MDLLVTLVIVLLFVGFALYLITLLPIDATIKKIIQALIVFFAIIYVLKALGLLARLGGL